MKHFISSCLLLFGVVYAQNLNQNINQFKTNSFVRPVAKDSIEVLSFLEVSNNALQFLKKDGVLHLSVPLNFRLHGPIPDGFRITEYGLKYLLESFQALLQQYG